MATDSTAPFGNAYLKIVKKLAEVAELAYIEQDFGQLEEAKPPVKWPCALIDIDEFEFSDMSTGSNNRQTGDGFIKIRISDLQWNSSNSLAPEALRKKAMAYHELAHKVYECLHGWRDTGFSKLLRRKQFIEKRDDNRRVVVIIFHTSVEDYSAEKTKISVQRPAATIATNSA